MFITKDKIKSPVFCGRGIDLIEVNLLKVYFSEEVEEIDSSYLLSKLALMRKDFLSWLYSLDLTNFNKAIEVLKLHKIPNKIEKQINQLF